MGELTDARKLHCSMWAILMPFFEQPQIDKVFHNDGHNRLVLRKEIGIDVEGDIFDTAMNAYMVGGETEEGTYRNLKTICEVHMNF